MDHTAFRSLEHDRIFGYAELLPEWTYEMFLEHVLPEDRPAVDGKFRQAMETKGDWNFECRIRRATGEVRWIMAAGRHRPDATGAPRRMAGIVQDITARKQAEEALKESEERFHAMFERHHAVKLMIEPETGAIVDANAAAYRFYGYSREQLCSLRIQDINQLPPDEVAAERAKAAAEQRNYFVFPHRLANGEVRWVEVYSTLVETRRRPLLYSIIHDVTDRARAEEALRESEERYRNLFDNMTEAFAVHEIVTDEHGRPSDYRFIEVNAAFEQMTGLNQRDILNRNVRDVLPEIEPFWIETYGRVALTREPVNFEHYYPAPLNRWYQVCAYCPAPGQFATVFWDVSSRKRAEQALQEANATLEQKVQERTSELAQRAAQLRALAGELTLSEQRERSRLAKVLHDHLQQLLVAAKFRLTVLGRGGDDVVKQATKEVEELIDESIAASRSLTAELSPPILHEAGLNAGLQWLARRMADTQGLFVDLEMERERSLCLKT